MTARHAARAAELAALALPALVLLGNGLRSTAGHMSPAEVFGLVLALIGLFGCVVVLVDTFRPDTLADRPPRFLDEQQVQHARQAAEHHADVAYFRALRREVRNG